MKKNIIAMLVLGAAVSTMVMGCGKKAEDTTAKQAVETTVAAETTTAVETTAAESKTAESTAAATNDYKAMVQAFVESKCWELATPGKQEMIAVTDEGNSADVTQLSDKAHMTTVDVTVDVKAVKDNGDGTKTSEFTLDMPVNDTFNMVNFASVDENAVVGEKTVTDDPTVSTFKVKKADKEFEVKLEENAEFRLDQNKGYKMDYKLTYPTELDNTFVWCVDDCAGMLPAASADKDVMPISYVFEMN